MAQATTPADASQSRSRTWWQFSLLNLLLVAVIACVAAAYFGSRHELENVKRANSTQRAELEELRKKIGVLAVVDDSKLYLQAHQDPFEENMFHWRWRAHLPTLPPTSQWVFKSQLGNVEPTGFGKPMSAVSSQLIDGQFDVDATIERQLDGSARLSIFARGSRRGLGGNVRLSEEDLKSLRALVNRGATRMSGKRLLVTSPSDRLEFLRIPSSDRPGEQTGLLIWLERIDDNSSATKSAE
jgi:hypothetical protein